MSQPFPDAVLADEAMKTGSNHVDRINSVLDVVEPILGVDRSKGERAYIRRQPGNQMFITRDPFDTILHPLGHPSEGRERYRWEPVLSGIRKGYLIHDLSGTIEAAS
jgi:hypothetical protein